jgi:hypothetical protein
MLPLYAAIYFLQGLPGVCNGAISEAVFNLTVGGLAAMAVQACLIYKHTNWQVTQTHTHLHTHRALVCAGLKHASRPKAHLRCVLCFVSVVVCQLVWLLLPPILVGTGVGMAVLYHVHSLWLKRVLGLVFLR